MIKFWKHVAHNLLHAYCHLIDSSHFFSLSVTMSGWCAHVSPPEGTLLILLFVSLDFSSHHPLLWQSSLILFSFISFTLLTYPHISPIFCVFGCWFIIYCYVYSDAPFCPDLDYFFVFYNKCCICICLFWRISWHNFWWPYMGTPTRHCAAFRIIEQMSIFRSWFTYIFAVNSLMIL